MFYKLLGVLTWKAIKHYVQYKMPSRRIVAGAVVAAVAAIAIGGALKGRQDDV